MQVGQNVLVQSAPVTYSVVVEDGPVDAENTYPYQGRNDASTFRVRVSTIMALTMAMLGSSVIPVSYAFATTGITCGLLISLVRESLNAKADHCLRLVIVLTANEMRVPFREFTFH